MQNEETTEHNYYPHYSHASFIVCKRR